MKRARLLAAIVSLAAIGLGIWAFAWEPASLVQREQELAIPHWSAEFSPLKVAVLADLHVGSPFNGIAKLGRIVEATNALEPDLVLLPGDFVIQEVLFGSFVAPEQAASILARLSAPLGVWATLGNHDWWHDPREVAGALERHGIRVLEDKAVRIQRGDAHFWLVGISDFREGPHDLRAAFEAVKDRAPVLAFTHNPDVFPEIRHRFNLLIAGHTHGGQVAIPFVGRPIVPSSYGERFAHGHVIEGGRHLYVSPGLGTSILPVRFRVPPEVTLLRLVSASPAPAFERKSSR